MTAALQDAAAPARGAGISARFWSAASPLPLWILPPSDRRCQVGCPLSHLQVASGFGFRISDFGFHTLNPMNTLERNHVLPSLQPPLNDLRSRFGPRLQAVHPVRANEIYFHAQM